jgi:two-component system, LytTR family, response regulator
MRVVIVDDEELARARLRRLLAGQVDVEVVGDFGDARRALADVPGLAPDLALLDIRMPRHDGFELAEVCRAVGCAVVFVTAWSEHAVAAFDAEAVDYLVKPVDAERLGRAVERARQRQHRLADDAAPAPPAPSLPPVGAQPRLAVREGGKIAFVDHAAVDAAVARGNYVELHAGGGRHVVRMTLSELERRAEPGAFVRIHRSILVRVARIATIEPLFHGEYLITLAGGETFTSARGHRGALRRALGLG